MLSIRASSAPQARMREEKRVDHGHALRKRPLRCVDCNALAPRLIANRQYVVRRHDRPSVEVSIAMRDARSALVLIGANQLNLEHRHTDALRHRLPSNPVLATESMPSTTSTRPSRKLCSATAMATERAVAFVAWREVVGPVNARSIVSPRR